MKPHVYQLAFVLYIVALVVLGIQQLLPALTGTPWPATIADILHANGMAAAILATCIVVVELCCVLRFHGRVGLPWVRSADPVQSQILGHADRLYYDKAHYGRDSFCAHDMAYYLQMDLLDPRLQKALADLVKAKNLKSRVTSPQSYHHRAEPVTVVYSLPHKRQMKILDAKLRDFAMKKKSWK